MFLLLRSSHGFSRRWLQTNRGAMHMAATMESCKSSIKESPTFTHPAFEVTKDEIVEEYGVRATMYKHVKSGAEVLSVQADDENKVFGITFRTPPMDSTGVPHILEHSVLCGSRKFKSKEPFVELLKGSLQTFLNAFTYPDRTCYPVASCNLKDFYNLVNVYLDAVLHPRAVTDELVLQQEGWHYELEKPEDPLIYKGVVYNEMKGVYSSPDSLLGRAAQQALFTDNTYGVDSGGDPIVIPELTFDGFKSFHAEFYHPSNSRIFFYGDDPVPARLDLLDEYLSDFDAIVPDSVIGIQKKLNLGASLAAATEGKKSQRIVEKFPAVEGEQANKHMVQVNWLLNEEPLSAKEQLAVSVLDSLLMGTQSATLRKALTESSLGEAVIGGGLSDELSQATYSVGLKGVTAENVDKVETLIAETLMKFSVEGPDASALDASINSMEFALREFNTGSFPRGLSFMLGAMSSWIYDRDPLGALRFEQPLAELKEDLVAGKPLFQDLVKDLLLHNTHKVTIELVPDIELEKEQVAAEEQRLSEVKASMSDDDIDKVIVETARLKAAQAAHDSPEQLATIPTLTLEDLSAEPLELPNEVTTTAEGVTVFRHEVPSNGILYADVGLDLTQLPASELPLVSLFSRCLLECGTMEEDEVSLSRRIGSRTGGVFTGMMSGVKHPADDTVAVGDELVHMLFMRGKVVMSKPEELFGIVSDVLLGARFDNQKRIVEMLKESKARMESSLVSSGHSYASARLSSVHTVAGALGEATGGTSYLSVLRQLLETAQNDFPALQVRLESIRDRILTKETMVINLSGDKKTLDQADVALGTFLSGLPTNAPGESMLETWKSELAPREFENEGFVVPTQVNYVGKTGRLYEPGERVPGSSSVVARALRTGYLWDNVRVIGGAYGGFARFSALTGSFTYLSYRDPNLLGTIENYDGAGAFLKATELTDEALTQAIIGAVGDLDGPLSPDQKGWEAMRRYLVQETAEQRATWRKEILETTKDDFVAFGERLEKRMTEKSCVAVFGSKQAIEDANTELAKQAKQQLGIKELLQSSN